MAVGDNSQISRRYWKKYVENPCNAVLRGDCKVEDHLDSDCKIAPSADQHIATGGLAFNNSGLVGAHLVTAVPRTLKAVPPHRDVPEKKITKKDSKQDANGLWTHNVKGVKICGAFNADKCQKGKCPRNEAHQCNKCLQNSHAAPRCGQPHVKVKQERTKHQGGKGGKIK